jgi:hypothetical protein
MNNRRLLQLAKALQGKAPYEVDEALRRQHLDPTEHLAVKVELAAGAAPGRRVQAQVELAADTAVYAPPQERPKTAMDRLLERVGIHDQRQYTELELSELSQGAGLETEQRLAVKIEAEARGLMRYTSTTDRLLQQLGIDGPLDQLALEQRLDRHGVGSVAMRTAVRAECQRRGWLRGGGNRSIWWIRSTSHLGLLGRFMWKYFHILNRWASRGHCMVTVQGHDTR